jgi:catechol 2,3-dioxygenase-like lactoylglutathione lyase family enzyme
MRTADVSLLPPQPLVAGPGITRLGSVPVFVRDQDRALAFYRDQLGFEVVLDLPLGGGRRWIAVARQRGETELILFHPASYAAGDEETAALDARVGQWTGIVFFTEDIEHTYRLLHERGVRFAAAPKRQAWGGWEAFFSDPEGNRFHLVQRPATL